MMKIYLENEIKKVVYDIGRLRDELSNARYYQTEAAERGDEDGFDLFETPIERIESDLMEQKAYLNNLKRELRYLDVSDDYTIHKISMDELSRFPRSREAILMIF